MIPYLSIFMIKDYMEILFFSLFVYGFSRWLLYDHTKKLIPYFYAYLLTFSAAHYYGLTTINFFLLLTLPGVIGIFILAHQETLQKNLIGLKNITTATKTHLDWIEPLMQTVLHQMNRKKDMLCIIEKTDALSPFITPLFELEAPLTIDLLAILCDSPSYNSTKMLWLSYNGIVKGVNCSWDSQTTPNFALLYETTRLYTQANDALFFHAHALTNKATVIAQGTVEKDYSIHQLHQIVRKHRSSSSSLKKGVPYEHQSSHTNIQKPSA